MAQAESPNNLPSELNPGMPKPAAPKPEAPEPAPRSVTIRRKSLVIAFFAALAAVGAAYLSGWTLQWREVSRAKEARDTATAELGAKVKALELRVLRLEARRQLALSLSALDERNFGIASERLASAGLTIQKAPSGAAMSKLASEIQAFRLVATENLAEQRSRILAWSKTLDQLLSETK